MTNTHRPAVGAHAVVAPVARRTAGRILRTVRVFVFIAVAAAALVAAISPEVFASGLMTVAQFAYDAANSVTTR